MLTKLISGTEKIVQRVQGSFYSADLMSFRFRAENASNLAEQRITVSTPLEQLNYRIVTEINDSLKNLIMLGPPGCGKGTQATILQSTLKINPDNHFSAGNMLRNLCKNAAEDDFGKLGISRQDNLETEAIIIGDPRTVQEIETARAASETPFCGISSYDWLQYAVSKGRLVPDEWTQRLFEHTLGSANLEEGFILDGYPRTKQAAEHLVSFFNATGIRVDRVVVLDAPYETIRKRLMISQRGREDDSSEIVEKRLASHIQNEKPAIEFLEAVYGDKFVYIRDKTVFDGQGGKVNIAASINLTTAEILKHFTIQTLEISIERQHERGKN